MGSADIPGASLAWPALGLAGISDRRDQRALRLGCDAVWTRRMLAGWAAVLGAHAAERGRNCTPRPASPPAAIPLTTWATMRAAPSPARWGRCRQPVRASKPIVDLAYFQVRRTCGAGWPRALYAGARWQGRAPASRERGCSRAGTIPGVAHGARGPGGPVGRPQEGRPASHQVRPTLGGRSESRHR